jgi:hypothetical protein
MDLSDFYIKGFVKLYESNLEDKDNITDYLGEKYLSQLFPHWQLKEFGKSERVEESDRITRWHNDSQYVGCNVTFLYYMDDMDETTGGSISIRNGIFEEKIYPSKGTLILMSQQRNVEHKVEECNTTRRMFNIDYFIDGLT